MKSRRRKVLGLFPSLSLTGGIQATGRITWEGIENFEKRNARCQIEHYLFCYGSNRPADTQLTSDNVTYAFSKMNAIVEALRKRWSADLVLVWHLGLLKLLPFFRIREAEVALFLHGIEAWKLQDWLGRKLLRRVNLFLSNSDYTWQRFVEWNPEFRDRPHRVVPLGLGSPLAGEIPAPEDRPIAFMLGRMLKSEDYKGHREMIAAWPLVLERIPDARLWIAGDGDLRSDLERLVRERGLQRYVRFWGWVSEEKKQELLAQCRCLAMPSRAEGFGLVYLEAMRLGRPCLVSEFDAGREIVNPPECGLAVDPKDSSSLVKALCKLLSGGEEWKTWSENARLRYEQNFTAYHFQQRLISALSEYIE